MERSRTVGIITLTDPPSITIQPLKPVSFKQLGPRKTWVRAVLKKEDKMKNRQRLSVIVIICSLLIGLPFPSSAKKENWQLNIFDHEVLQSLHSELSQISGTLEFIGPSYTAPAFTGFQMTAVKTGSEEINIAGASFNGLNVLSKLKVKRWNEWGGKKYARIDFNPGYTLREGTHYFMVKYNQARAVSAQVMLIVIAGQGTETKQTSHKIAASSRASKIMGNLSKTQQKLRSFSSQLTGRFESYGGGNGNIFMDFTGRLNITGWNQFHVTLAAPPLFTIKQGGKTPTSPDQKWKKLFPNYHLVDRNRPGAWMSAFYLDYLLILDHYNWEISNENADELVLLGYANEMAQAPYQYLIRVDKKRWVPLEVQTYLDGQTVISWAKVECKKIKGFEVPTRQVTTSIFKNKMLQEYTLDTSRDIKVNP